MSKESKKKPGVLWLKFFCFWRPWIAFAFAVIMVILLITYEEYRAYYFSNIFGCISIGLYFLNVMLLIELFFTAKKRSSKAIELIDLILTLEVAVSAYSVALRISFGLLGFIVSFAILYFMDYSIWYKPNMKYFLKREYWFCDEPYSDSKEDKIVVQKKSEHYKNNDAKSRQDRKHISSEEKHARAESTMLGCLIILLFLFFVSVGFNIYQAIESKNEISKLNQELSDSRFEHFELTNEMETYQIKAEFLEDNIVFVIANHGNYYYTYDCFKKITDAYGNYSYWAYNEEQAISKGYKEGSC